MTSSPTPNTKAPEGAEYVQRVADRLVLEITCHACPEQYNAKLDGAQVGYLRLRHGQFRVDYPDCGEETILSGEPNGDGIFDDDERAGWLEKARMAIAKAIVFGTEAEG